MNEYVIRKAEKADCGHMLVLIQELAEFERAPDEVTVTLREFEDAGFGENPVWEAFVVESNAVIHGLALYYIRYSTWKGRRLYLEDIIVTEKMRGKGLGTILFNKVWETCKTRNYSGMTWQVLDWNAAAIRFYQKYKADFDKGWLNVSLTNKNNNQSPGIRQN